MGADSKHVSCKYKHCLRKPLSRGLLISVLFYGLIATCPHLPLSIFKSQVMGYEENC